MPAELIDIDCFVVFPYLAESESFLRDERLDGVILVQLHAGSVHPGFVFVHQGQRLTRIIDDRLQHGILKDNIRLEQQRIIFTEQFFGKGQRIDIVRLVVIRVVDEHHRRLVVQRADMIDQFLPFIAHDNNDAGKMKSLDLTQHPVDQRNSVYLYHAFCIIFCQVFQPSAHPSCQNYCLHNQISLIMFNISFITLILYDNTTTIFIPVSSCRRPESRSQKRRTDPSARRRPLISDRNSQMSFCLLFHSPHSGTHPSPPRYFCTNPRSHQCWAS